MTINNLILYAAIVGGVALVAVVGTVIFVRRRKTMSDKLSPMSGNSLLKLDC
jgi:uncharacterized membrane protein